MIDRERKRAYDRDRYARHREAERAKRRALYAANRDTILAKQNEYNAAHREARNARYRERYRLKHAELRQKAKVYEQANRERRAALHKQWLAEHREATREYDRRRHARDPMPKRLGARKRKAILRGARVGPIDYRAIISASQDICALCQGPIAPEERSFDHIIPLAHGGPHSQDNLQLTHLKCNLERGARPLPS